MPSRNPRNVSSPISVGGDHIKSKSHCEGIISSPSITGEIFFPGLNESRFGASEVKDDQNESYYCTLQRNPRMRNEKEKISVK